MEQSFKKEFSSRYDMHSSELKELYMELYNDEESYLSLVGKMYAAWESRSAALKKLEGFDRRDCSGIVTDAGFDIRTTAAFLQEFYCVLFLSRNYLK